MPNTIRVRLLTLAAGPDFQIHPDGQADLPAAQAEEMIAAGYAQRMSPAPATEPAAPTASPAEVEAGPESWTATAEEAEADGDGEDDEEEPVADSSSPTGPVETATAGPQRNGDADDQLAAEKAGAEAALAKELRTANPYDGRSSLGRAWFRGWDSVK